VIDPVDECLSLLELACGLCFTDAVCLILGMDQGLHSGADGSSFSHGPSSSPSGPSSLVTPKALHLFVRAAVHTTARQAYLKTFALLLSRADSSVLDAANEYGESLLREAIQLSVTSSFRRELLQELLQTGPELAVEGKLESWSAFEALVRTRDPGSLALMLEHISTVTRGEPASSVTLRVLGVSRAFDLSVRLGASPCLLQFLNTEFIADLFEDVAPLAVAFSCRQYDVLRCLTDFVAGRAATANNTVEQRMWLSQFSVVSEALCLGRTEEADVLLGRLDALARAQSDQSLYSGLVDLCTGADDRGLTLLTAALLSGSVPLIQKVAGLLRRLGALRYSVLGCDLVSLAHAAPGIAPEAVSAAEELHKEVCGQLPGQKRVTTTPGEYGILLENYLAFLARGFGQPSGDDRASSSQRRDSRRDAFGKRSPVAESLNLGLLPSAPPGFSPCTEPLPCGRTVVEVGYASLPPEVARAVFLRLGLLPESLEPTGANGVSFPGAGGNSPGEASDLQGSVMEPRSLPPPDVLTRLFVLNATRRDISSATRQSWARLLLDLGCDPSHEVMANGRTLRAARFM